MTHPYVRVRSTIPKPFKFFLKVYITTIEKINNKKKSQMLQFYILLL